MRVKALVAMVAAVAMAGSAFAAEGIKVGGIFDLTGATGDVGKDYATGVNDAIEMINAKGGVGGRKIDMDWADYAYKIPESINLYKKYRDQNKAVLVQGWGTGDTEALSTEVAKDKIPYISASYSAHLTDPAKTPYNFFAGANYSDGLRIALKYLKENFKEARKPKVVFVYPDNPFGKAAIPAGKKMAEALGYEIGPDEIVAQTATEAVSQLTHMKQFDPDYAFWAGTVAPMAVVIKDAKKLGLRTRFFTGVWGLDETLVKRAGEASEGAIGIAPFAFYGADVPGMKAILEIHKTKHPNDTHTVRYVQGWVSALVMEEAMKRAKTIDGPGLKAALETFKDFETGGLTAPITFTPDDHRASTSVRLYTIKGGKVEMLSDMISIPREKANFGW